MNRMRRHFALAWLAAASGCTCEKRESPEEVRKLFETLFGELPAARVARPLDAIPDLDFVLTSPDPEAWRAWAAGQPFIQRMMKTPLYDDLRVSKTYLALDSLSRRAARAAAWTQGRDAPGAQDPIWRGPTALGFVRSEAGRGPSRFVLAKRIDPATQGLVRFAAAFAMAAKKQKAAGYGATVLDLGAAGEFSFVLFKDLLIAGSDRALVERARLLALKEAKEKPASEGALKAIVPKAAEPGIHGAIQLPRGGFAELFAADGLGFSLVQDQKAPLVLRKAGAHAPDAEALSLLRYAPLDAFLAVVDGGTPSGEVFMELHHRLDRAGEEFREQGKDETARAERPDEEEEVSPAVTAGEIEKTIIPKLSAGIAFVAGAKGGDADPESMQAFLALRHAGDKDGLEPGVRKMLGAITNRPVARTVLEDMGGALLLQPEGESGPAAALTKDALLLSLSADRLRLAVAAGAGKAPSLQDRKGMSLGEKSSGGVYVDLEKTAAFLLGFYAAALEKDPRVPWKEASASLEPTFKALATGGALFARLLGTRELEAEGALHVLP